VTETYLIVQTKTTIVVVIVFNSPIHVHIRVHVEAITARLTPPALDLHSTFSRALRMLKAFLLESSAEEGLLRSIVTTK
jgi:hypothetical protein